MLVCVYPVVWRLDVPPGFICNLFGVDAVGVSIMSCLGISHTWNLLSASLLVTFQGLCAQKMASCVGVSSWVCMCHVYLRHDHVQVDSIINYH